MGGSIGEYAVVGACSLVNKNVPAYATAVGVPCRIIMNHDVSSVQEEAMARNGNICLAGTEEKEKYNENNEE